MNTQLPQMIQNDLLNVLISDTLNLSSSAIIFPASPSILSAYLSIIIRPIPVITEIMQMKNPIKKAKPKLSVAAYADGTIALFITLPILDTLRFKPSAKANSLPLNHFETIADWDTLKHSPPRLIFE